MERSLRLATLVGVVVAVAMTAAAAGPAPAPGVVNVNTASAEQLALLPGVGPALAKRIVAFRTENGPFRSLDELVAVRGIGERSLGRMKPYVTLEGPTTLKEKVRLRRSRRQPS